MEKSNQQLERNVAASFGYVKKDVLMLNDSYTKLQEAVTQLTAHYKVLQDEIKKLKDTKKPATKPVATKKAAKKTAKKTVVKKVVVKKVTKKDDLKLIEGVGPVLEKFLNKNNLKSFKDVSKKTGKELKTILDKEGTKYQMHDPSSWPKQAKLASEGKLTELKKYQDTLNTKKGSKTTKKVAKKGVKKVVRTETTYE